MQERFKPEDRKQKKRDHVGLAFAKQFGLRL